MSNAFQEGLDKAWQAFLEKERERRYPNIMLLGISGAGKSSLVNRVFGMDLARVSNVAPETKGYCNYYDGHNYSKKINLIDTAGYELNQSDSYLTSISSAINSTYKGEPIHVLWYCLSIGNERIEAIDLRILRAIMKMEGIRERVCIVFTHCDLDDNEGSKERAFLKVLQNNGLAGLQSFEVSTDPDLPLQLSELVSWSAGQLKDEDFRQSFIGSQMADLDLKKKEAQTIINKASALVAFTKVTEALTDDNKAESLAEHQMRMVTRIFSIYGIDCLAGLIDKFERTTALVDFVNGIVSYVIKKIPELEKCEGAIRVIAAPVFTKLVGSIASEISYSYVEKHIKGIPVVFEEYFSDENSAGFIATLFIEGASALGFKLQGKNKTKENCVVQEESKNDKAVKGKKNKKQKSSK